jgi:hypothetical protein
MLIYQLDIFSKVEISPSDLHTEDIDEFFCIGGATAHTPIFFILLSLSFNNSSLIIHFFSLKVKRFLRTKEAKNL